MLKGLSSRVVTSILASMVCLAVIMPGCTVGPIVVNVDGTYNLNVTSAPSGSFLPAGTTGPVTIANGQLTNWLGAPTTNPQNATMNGTQIIFKATVADPTNPLISTELTLTVVNQGGGTLTGEAFFSIFGIAGPASQVTLQLQ